MARAVGAQEMLRALQDAAPRPLTIAEIARRLGVLDFDRRQMKATLEAAVAERKVRRIGKTRYQWVPAAEVTPATLRLRAATRRPKVPLGVEEERFEGRYQRVRGGYGFVEVLGAAARRFARDVLIPAGAENGAMHGDRVEIEVVRRDPRLRRVVGRVTRVIASVHETILGTLEPTRRGWQLVPELDLLPTVQLVGPRQPRRDQAGLVARVRLVRPPTAGYPAAGELEVVLGPVEHPDVQFAIITAEHGLRTEFPEAARNEAERLPEDPEPGDYRDRLDLRALPFVTIDGETARDFDDAVCLQVQSNGERVLWVAIADVSYYVPEGSALDHEALARGTSVYFPDRAIPMFPEKLSDQLCSLVPERDRLVLVAELHYDRHGHRKHSELYPAVIRSRARLTYTKVAAVISDAVSAEIDAWRASLGPILDDLRQMHVLMQQLNRARLAAGSLDLDLPEALIDLSEEGRSVGVRLLARNDAHRIIEEFMLEANRAVALFLREQRVPFPYRVHEQPDPNDIEELNRFLARFGFGVQYEGQVRPQDVARVLQQIEGHPLARVLSRQVLRALRQAQYSTVNIGHFGLAFPVYCHFTSPIRRYPDLLVHRQLRRVLAGQVEEARALAERLEELSVHCSQCERQAVEAERAMLDLKKCEFMFDHLLEPEPGTIVSVTNFGCFVELDAYPIEGLLKPESFPGDRYYYHEEDQAWIGARRRQRFTIGDRVRVECTNVSLRRREIDFALLERLPPAGSKAAETVAEEPTGRRRLRKGKK
ncbi:MAG: ribonuclease R [Candidatus Binatia bacterium]|nr:MAG: ribonuclease R [Candidatus Binatia bacterium]